MVQRHRHIHVVASTISLPSQDIHPITTILPPLNPILGDTMNNHVNLVVPTLNKDA